MTSSCLWHYVVSSAWTPKLVRVDRKTKKNKGKFWKKKLEEIAKDKTKAKIHNLKPIVSHVFKWHN